MADLSLFKSGLVLQLNHEQTCVCPTKWSLLAV